MTDHPVDRLADLAAGLLAPVEAAAVRTHLNECAACTTELRAWITTAEAVRTRAALAVPPPSLATGIVGAVAAAQAAAGAPPSSFRRRLRWLGQFVAGQVPVVRREIWPASLVVMAIGVALTIVSPRGSAPGAGIALFAPLAAAIGVAMIYGQENDPSLELALATPTSPRLVVLARLVVVLAFDLALALAVSLVLVLANGPAIAAPLVGSWLGPMLLLGSLSLVLSLLVGTPAAIVVGGFLWAVRLATLSDSRLARELGAVSAASGTLWQTSLLTLGLAAAGFLVALAILSRTDGVGTTGSAVAP